MLCKEEGRCTMSGTKKAEDYSPEFMEIFLSTIDNCDDKETIRKIVGRFIDCGLPVKVKRYNQKVMDGTYRILCFIKKSAEAVIINNKGMGREGVSIQVRIVDRSVLDKLDELSENIRNQILNAADCGHHSVKCDKQYAFTYRKNKHEKCHFLCNNFCFQNMNEQDVYTLMEIIKNEIEYKLTRAK